MKNRKYTNNFFRAMILYRSFFLYFLIIIACSSSNSEDDWTILIYMAADNSLNESALLDIAELQASEFSEKINVIVQIDHRNQDAVNDYTGGERWQIFPNSKQLISRMGEIDSGSPEELADFIDWGFSKFKSHKKALILWSHGNGWYDLYNKFCPDKTSLTSLNIPKGDLHNALKWANQEIDILIFDACNMQTIEVIAEVSDYAKYVIGSQDEIKVSGFPYQEIMESWETYEATEELAKGIVEKFIHSYMPFTGSQNSDGSVFTFSCSAVNTTKLHEFNQSVKQFSLIHDIQPEVLQNTREACVEFNDPKIDVDVYQFFLKLYDFIPTPELDLILTDINELFLVNYAFYPNESMMSLIDRSSELGFATIWFPDKLNEYNGLYSTYDKLLFSKESNWKFFLEYFFSQVENNPPL